VFLFFSAATHFLDFGALTFLQLNQPIHLDNAGRRTSFGKPSSYDSTAARLLLDPFENKSYF
jgi:hypothetical protein